jgi:50S ribosomal subunit-associated GTPase HflX
VTRVKKNYPGAQLISAKSGENVEKLLHQIDKGLNTPRKYTLSVPQTHQKAISYTHQWGRILEKGYDDGFVKMTVEMGSEEIRNLEDYVV